MSIDSAEILARLQSEAGPLSFAKLKKSLAGKKTGHSEGDLRAALNAGGIFAWPKNSYWHIDPEEQLRAEVLSLCAKKALKRTEIKVKGRTPKDTGATVERLAAEKKLLKYPALAGAGVLFVAASSPKAYWAYVEEFVATKLRKAGIEEANLEEKLWEILPKLESEKDVPVSIARVRRALGLAEADKQRFDEAALKLREQRRVYLSQHDHPLGLSAEDRAWLIDGKDGRYYVAITRLEP
jgi:hypothetical protein